MVLTKVSATTFVVIMIHSMVFPDRSCENTEWEGNVVGVIEETDFHQGILYCVRY